MNCPKCDCNYTYEVQGIWNCPECGYEWSADAMEADGIFDSNGKKLENGDSVIVIKDLKIKGSSSNLKQGTKIKNIRLTEDNDGHNIACKVDGIGSINIKSIYVKKG